MSKSIPGPSDPALAMDVCDISGSAWLGHHVFPSTLSPGEAANPAQSVQHWEGWKLPPQILFLITAISKGEQGRRGSFVSPAGGSTAAPAALPGWHLPKPFPAKSPGIQFPVSRQLQQPGFLCG